MFVITFDGHDYIVDETYGGRQFHIWDSQRKLYQGEVWQDETQEYWH